MKKEKFSKYIEHELMVIDEKITSLTTKKETLQEKVDNILTKDNLKKLRNDYKNQNSKSIFNLFKSYRKEKLIDFYIRGLLLL